MISLHGKHLVLELSLLKQKRIWYFNCIFLLMWKWSIERTVDPCVVTKKEIHTRTQELGVRAGYNIRTSMLHTGWSSTCCRLWRWHGQM